MTGSCTQTTVLSYLSFQNWKKLNVTNILWFKVVGWYFQTPTEIAMSSGQPVKAHVNRPITEWIHCGELLFNTTYQLASTIWPNLFSQLQ